MKRLTKVVSALAFLLCLTSPVLGKGKPGVANTIHNLSTSAPTFGLFTYNSNVDEICVFCHTPHGGALVDPLWNHSLPGNNTFTHYNSATLSSTLQGLSPARIVNDESLVCMACHDGSVAIDHLVNNPNSLKGSPITFFGGSTGVEMPDMFGGLGSRIGASLSVPNGTGDLSDDHPISFSYKDVYDDGIYQPGGSRAGELRDIGDATLADSVLGYKGEGVRLFGTDFRVECSSCHDPHVDYISGINTEDYTPFLIRPNSGSDLCLACHNK